MILNRELDPTEQRKVFSVNLPQTGASYVVQTGYTAAIMVPYTCTLDAAMMFCAGVSGALQVQINVDRFIIGTGFTTQIVAKGTSNLAQSFGTSGIGLVGGLNMVLAGIPLLPNDVLQISTLGANAAATQLGVSVVLRPTTDVKVQFGI